MQLSFQIYKNTDFAYFSLVDSNFIILWIQVTSREFKVYYPKTNSLVSVHQKEYHVCFFQTSATSPKKKAGQI